MEPVTPIKQVIVALKSHNWYTQNLALSGLSKRIQEEIDLNSLFVLGRNIYQAACGGANAANGFIKNFPSRMIGVEIMKQKAVLDGMIFELFFNSKGELRRDFKTSNFEELFELRKVPEYESSFALIADVLTPYQSRFYVLPGLSKYVNVIIKTVERRPDEKIINEIIFDETNILRSNSYEDSMGEFSFPIKYDQLVQQISVALLIPVSHLTIVPDFDPVSTKLLIPFDAVMNK